MEKQTHMGEKLQQETKRLGLKPAQVADFFGVKPPSVYDWYAHGRISKKHYPKLVELTNKPLTWWLDFPNDTSHTSEPLPPTYADIDPRQKILLDLFEGLPGKEQDELIRTLTEKKQYYDAVIEEFLARRNAA